MATAPPFPAASRQRDQPTSDRWSLASEVGAVALLTAEAVGQVRIHLDVEAFDFHMDVAPEAHVKWVRASLACLEMLGYVPIPLDEDDPELLDDDWVRRYLVPIEPVEHGYELVIVAPRVAA